MEITTTPTRSASNVHVHSPSVGMVYNYETGAYVSKYFQPNHLYGLYLYNIYTLHRTLSIKIKILLHTHQKDSH